MNEKKILIADDNETLLMALQYSIQQAGYIVHKAPDGEKALALALETNPDVIVSDITMPEMDGLEFCRKIRALPQFADIPFIFLTAHGELEDRLRGLRTGADDYIVKPFEVEELIVKIEILFNSLQKRRYSDTLSGNLAQLSLPDLLQVFAQSKKEGVLTIRADGGEGRIALRDANLMDAAFKEFAGEDALVELLQLESGNFHFIPQAVPDGPMNLPVSLAMFDVVRLADERNELRKYIPDFSSMLLLHGVSKLDDADSRELARIVGQCPVTGADAWKNSGLSRIRAEVGLALLAREGVLAVEKPVAPADLGVKCEGRPVTLLLVYTDPAAASGFLTLTVNAFSHHGVTGQKAGVPDLTRITAWNTPIQIFSLRGEKKFSFLWEPMLMTSNGVIFLISSPEDREHADFFEEQLAHLRSIPFMTATMNEQMKAAGTPCLLNRETMTKYFLQVLQGLD